MRITKIKVVIVEDSLEFSTALKKVLEEQNRFPCEVFVLNPVRAELPSFEQFHDEIVGHAGNFGSLVLMDNSLGRWKWKGAHLAPSFHNIVSISTDEMSWARFNFTNKTAIAYHDNEKAKIDFVDTILKALGELTPPGFMETLLAKKTPVDVGTV